IHRSLGVHLTFVRSVNLDAWTQEQVTQMQKWGNAKAKEYFEALVPKDYRIPTEHSPVRDKEIWIRHKYERKRFVAREGEEPEASDAEEPAPARRATAKAAPPPPAADILNLGDFSTPAPPAAQTNAAFGNFAAPPAPAQNFDAFAAPPAPAKDEWAAFGGSSQQSNFGSNPSVQGGQFGSGPKANDPFQQPSSREKQHYGQLWRADGSTKCLCWFTTKSRSTRME
ncbi:hypothetical protein LEN26_003015, partial [Aphanomyces euteiches]